MEEIEQALLESGYPGYGSVNSVHTRDYGMNDIKLAEEDPEMLNMLLKLMMTDNRKAPPMAPSGTPQRQGLPPRPQ